jgi:hypothetical protein
MDSERETYSDTETESEMETDSEDERMKEKARRKPSFDDCYAGKPKYTEAITRSCPQSLRPKLTKLGG